MVEKSEFHGMTAKEVINSLGTTPRGLSWAGARQAEFGANELTDKAGFSRLAILSAQLRNPLNLVLLAAAVVS